MNNRNIYEKLSIINEDEQPCLKALMRKIRNYNKKLMDIKDMENKQSLKAEQIEKMNRKEKYEHERDKCVDFVTTYR